jgi:hypothetical protein
VGVDFIKMVILNRYSGSPKHIFKYAILLFFPKKTLTIGLGCSFLEGKKVDGVA